jgi:hypothetical protein
MTTREEYFTGVMKGTLQNAVKTLLRTKEYSSRFLPRRDVESIDKNIEKISSEVASRMISKLGARGLLEDQSKISKKEFEQLFRSTIEEYFGGLREGQTS